ncbi:hypothetical protein ACXYL9_00310 [Qipengyuania sp. CAU 1752]
MRQSIIVLAATTLTVAACSPQSDEQVSTDETGASETITADAENAGAPPQTDSETLSTIPAAMQGRWGLVPADCTSRRGDTKGLAEISANSIRFYESVATLGYARQTGDHALRGDFAFKGEGMEWTRELSLEAQPEDRKLVLEEFGDDAVLGARTYTRCP